MKHKLGVPVKVVGLIGVALLEIMSLEAGDGGLVLHVVEPVKGYESLYVHDINPDGSIIGAAYNYEQLEVLWMGPKGEIKTFQMPPWQQQAINQMNDTGMVAGGGWVREVEIPGGDVTVVDNIFVWNPKNRPKENHQCGEQIVHAR